MVSLASTPNQKTRPCSLLKTETVNHENTPGQSFLEQLGTWLDNLGGTAQLRFSHSGTPRSTHRLQPQTKVNLVGAQTNFHEGGTVNGFIVKIVV